MTVKSYALPAAFLLFQKCLSTDHLTGKASPGKTII